MSAPTEEPLGLAMLCFIASRAMEARVMAALADAGYGDISQQQARVFARLGPDGTRMGDLADQALVTKQTATSLGDHLERMGYVRRVPDPADQRARLVVFAPRGLQACEVAKRAEREVHAEWDRHLGRAEAKQVRAALTRLREITDPWM